MKLHRLELEGFGPFLHAQVVDFDAFDADGIFLIAGRTGAGKSSILDGVCFALYNTVPRYDGNERRLRSDHCRVDDPTRVQLELTVAGRRLRVTRSPEYERPKKRGTGTTTRPATAVLDELVDGEWVGIAARPRDVGLELAALLGLNAEQFQQVVLLAQNRFSRFLLAGNDDRQALLRTLFGTRAYDGYVRVIDDRARTAREEVAGLRARAETLVGEAERAARAIPDAGAEVEAPTCAEPGDEESAGPEESTVPSVDPPRATLWDRLAAAGADLGRARERVERSAAERSAAEDAYARADARWREVTTVRAIEQALARARSELSGREAQRDAVSAWRAELSAARAAGLLRAVVDDAERAEAAARAAAARVVRARESFDEAHQSASGDLDADAAHDATSLMAEAERLTGELALWRVAKAEERELPDNERRRAQLGETEAALVQRLRDIDAESAALPAQITEVDEALREERATAARLADAVARLTDLERRSTAAREAEALRSEQAAALEAYDGAVALSLSATETLRACVRRRLHDAAGALAVDLVAGTPCAVCGSVEHPAPAAPPADVVTDEEMARAEADRDAAGDREGRARERHTRASEAASAAAARAGGDSVETLSELIAEARSVVDAADRANDRIHALESRRAGLAARSDALASEREASLGDQRELAGQIAQADGAIERARTAVAQARGTHVTVEERVVAVTGARDAARALADALVESTRSGSLRAEAARQSEAAVAASDFDDREAVRLALRDDTMMERLDADIREYEAQLATARGLVEARTAELAGRSATDASVDEAATARATADRARAVAVGAEREATAALGALADLVDLAREACDALTGRAEDEAALTRLAGTLAGRGPNTMKMDLETFVLAAELEEIVHAANIRLGEMSAGRYTLHHSDARAARGAASGLGIEVLDAHTGRLRSPQSLSGGETFLASLALALGLAEVVTARAGGMRLDTLFIDEGFGALDAETLELAMRTLDELRTGGRTVGVISHVETMKEQLRAQVRVEQSPGGPSRIIPA